MSLFSKILNGGSDKSALNILKDVVGDVAKEAVAAAENAKKNFEANSSSSDKRPETDVHSWDTSLEKSGDSWGKAMPAEENQYNFNGSYLQYFSKVFREDFPVYTVQQEPGRDDRSPLFVFYRDGVKCLVVELKSERSSAQAIRRRCEAEGTPYLRFYYDHDGWWNTRSYVTRRVAAVLSGSM